MIDVRKFFKSVPFAVKGFINTSKTENNFKIHLFATFVVVILGIWRHLSISEWLWISLAVALVMLTELINTAIEAAINLVSPDFHPLAGKAKDAGAAAVLIASIFAIVVGCAIFITPLFE